MVTPPNTPPPPPKPIAPSSSMLKKTIKASRLRSLATRLVGVEKPVVHVDPTTGKVDDLHRKKLRTYLRIVIHNKVDVTYDNWKQVPAQNDLIWEGIEIFQLNVECCCNWQTTRKASMMKYVKSMA